MFSLKKWFEEAWAQAVPGDSKTAATVRASRQQAQPAVTTRKQTPRANIKPFKSPQIERAARNLRAGKMTPDAFANYVTSMGPSKDWRDSTSTGNKFVDGSINVAKGIGNTGTQVAKGLVNPDTYVGGVKRFNQAIASTILKPVSDRHADQERERAERLLIPSYENMYRAYGADPRLGKNQAQIEANMADYNLRTDPLRRNNINVNDSTGTVTRKVGAKGAEAFLDIVTAPMGGAALKAGAKGMVRPVLANTFKAGLTGSGNALAYAAQQDGMSGVDYIKAGSQGFAMGSAMPLVMGAAGRAMGGAVERLPRSTGKVYPYTNYKINETSSGKLKLSKDLPQTIETAKTALLNGKEAIKRLNADLGQGGYVKNPFYKDNPVTEGLSKKQSEFINDYAEMLEGMGSKNGVDITPDGRRISNNFRDADTAGKKMTKYDWFEKARKDIESGKAWFGASEDYKALPGVKSAPTQKTPQPKPTLQDALEGKSTKATPRAKPAEVQTKQLVELQAQSANQPKVKTPDQQSPQFQANQPSKQTSSVSLDKTRKSPVNTPDNTPIAPSSKEWGDILLQADTELPRFDAVAGAKGSSSAKRLADAINQDSAITKAAKQAQDTGKEINFFAKKDSTGRSVGIERFDPSQHRIEAGFVVDKKNNVLGNHIKVDETGIQVNVGGDLINMERIIGNPQDWKGRYRVSETMSRNIDANAPNKQIAQQTKDFVVGGKVKAEANYRVELEAEYNKLGKRIKDVQSARPRGVKKDQFDADVFDLLDGKKTDADMRASYDKKAADAILNYKKETRTLYDSLLERINKERVKFGQEPIQARKNYITHLQELNGNKSFTGEVYGSIKNSFTDEGAQRTRGGVPGQIAGRTENFEPRSAWNRYLQRRTGDKAIKDPYMAVQSYLEPALYNIHMTEAAVRARAVESAFRTAGELQAMKPEAVVKEANKLLKPYKSNTSTGKLVSGFQEYANALAKKTQRWDRQIIDASDATALGLEGWQKLQSKGGQATILGNVSSTLAQPLNQAIGLADAGPINWMKGIARTVRGDKTINKSPFITARRTKALAPIRGKGEKILDAGGVPLQKVEMASIEIIWNSQHSKALKAGHKGAKAIQQADYNTERLVAGRGIADRPELYRSTLTNGLLQYTLEVSAQNKAFRRDLTLKQKATFMVAASGMNYLWGNVTGYEPLPDFLGAAMDTGKDFADPEDERTAGQKTISGVQRVAGEVVGMNPMLSTAANVMLDQNDRKNLFGDESDLGRFEGTAAPIKVVQNTYSAGKNAAQGNYTAARNDALRVVPYGNQIRKTLTGAESNARGYAVDKSGNPTFAAPDNAIGQAQSLLFGPSSTKNAQTYYDNNQTSIRGKADTTAVKNSANPREAVNSIQQRRLDKKTSKTATEGSTPKEIYNAAFGTEEGQAMLALGTDKEREEQYPELFKDYKAMKTAFEYDRTKYRPDNYDKLSNDSKAIYDKLGSLTDEAQDKWLKRTASGSSEKVYNSLNAIKPKDYPDLPKTNEVAKMYADFESGQKENNWTGTRLESEKKKLVRSAYETVLDDNEKYILSANTTDTLAMVENGEVDKDTMDKLVQYDDLMIALGGSARISKTVRGKLGYSAATTKSYSSGSRSGSSTKIAKGKYSLADLLSSVQSTNKTLRQLLEQTLKG